MHQSSLKHWIVQVVLSALVPHQACGSSY
jgi:hypothetical protein